MSAEIKHEIRIARTRQKITKRMKIMNFNFLIIFLENTMITIARKAIIKKLFIVTFRFDLFT